MFVNYTAIQSCAFPDFITDESCCQIEQFFGACVYNGTYARTETSMHSGMELIQVKLSTKLQQKGRTVIQKVPSLTQLISKLW
ncbi:hypothetical protein L6164_017230 [Bauhinia variegata]|uniref:Uncharacterized protein n=1 Tax=Bauhinia variegata TaxID=167791 RepID=A0ACB9N723_BAUVA|nr:hypothetical protein L6164_017230 [Bauhinia variegata]